MSENYILPNELIVLLLVWFLPPLMLASIIEVFTFHKLGGLGKNYKRCIGAVTVTFITSIILGIFALQIKLPNWLAGSDNLLFQPVAFIIVFLVSLIVIGYSKYELRKTT